MRHEQTRNHAAAEAIVIGGGVFGAATAHRLSAKLPGGVMLLERNRIAQGSTAKAATLLSLARDKAAAISWVRRTYDLIREPEDPDGWENLMGCAVSLSPYFRSLEETGIAHYVSGFSGYAPDGLFCVGAFPEIPGLVAAAGCSGMGIAVSGGVGLAAAQLALGEEPFADTAPFAPERLGAVEPFSPEFMRRCAEARTAKKSG